MTPQTVRKFSEWLSARGAELLKPTNQYELIRFRTGAGVSVLYQKDNGRVTHTGESAAAFNAYEKGHSWRAVERTKRRASHVIRETLLDRDGSACFYCGKTMPPEDRTIEHLVSATHGGPNHISNLFLAHGECNKMAGHLSAPEKIKLHCEGVVKT